MDFWGREKYDSDASYIDALERTVDLLCAVNNDMSKMVRRAGHWAAKYTDRKRHFGDPSYPYIQYDQSSFLEAIYYLSYWFKDSVPFCDVGCGIGDKVWLAHNHGFQASGIENNPMLVRHAKRLFGITSTTNPKIILQDALKVDYSRYHVIYLYSPFQDNEMESKLERRVQRQAPLGSFIMMPKYVVPFSKSFDRIAEVGGIHIFRKIRQGKNRISAKSSI